MNVRVLYHYNCFDGACSASLFQRFYRECVATDASFEFVGLRHEAGGGLHEEQFTGDVNAIVDFKYSNSQKIQWWFDHHQSAFMSEADRKHFETEQARTDKQQMFFDPTYVSCAGLIADIAQERFGFKTDGLTDLLRWADIIDGAKFESADAAVGLAAPAMKIATAIEASADPSFIPRLIPLLTQQPLVETLEEDFVQEALQPLLEAHRRNITLLRSRAAAESGVITFDITDLTTEGYSKFIPYYLLPEAVYTVGLSRSSFRTKISLGTSPWTTVPTGQLANIAEICERFGGGGHPRVGAISLPAGGLDEARRIAAIVAGELKALGQWNQTPTRRL